MKKKFDNDSLVEPRIAVLMTCRFGFLPHVIAEALVLAKKKKRVVFFEFNAVLVKVEPDGDATKIWEAYNKTMGALRTQSQRERGELIGGD